MDDDRPCLDLCLVFLIIKGKSTFIFKIANFMIKLTPSLNWSSVLLHIVVSHTGTLLTRGVGRKPAVFPILRYFIIISSNSINCVPFRCSVLILCTKRYILNCTNVWNLIVMFVHYQNVILYVYHQNEL